MFPLQHLFSSLKAVVCWRYLQINPVFNFIPAISWMENIRVKRENLWIQNGLCIETQHFPNSPNQPKFPSVQLDPDQVYAHTCIYKFSVKMR